MFELPWMEIAGPARSTDRNFELLCCELAAVAFGLPRSLSPFGRQGQAQGGVDVVGTARSGQRVGIQSKLHRPPADPASIRRALTSWLEDLQAGDHELDLFVIAVPWPADTTIANWQLENNSRTESPCKVEVWTSDSLNRLAGAHPGIVHRYFGPDWAKDAWVYEYTERRAAIASGVSAYLDLDDDIATLGTMEECQRFGEATDLAKDIAERFERAGFGGHANGFWSKALQYASHGPSQRGFEERYLVQRLCEAIDDGRALDAWYRSRELATPMARPAKNLSQLGLAALEVYSVVAEFNLGTHDRQFPLLVEAMREAPGHDLLEHLALLAGEFALLRADALLVTRLASLLSVPGDDARAVRRQCLRIDAGLAHFDAARVDQLSDAGSRSFAWRRQACRLIRPIGSQGSVDDFADRVSALRRAADEALGERDGPVALQMWTEVFYQEQSVDGSFLIETQNILQSLYKMGDHRHPIADRMNRFSTEFLVDSSKDATGAATGLGLCALNAVRQGMRGIEREALRLRAAVLEREGETVGALECAITSESVELSQRLAKQVQCSISLEKFLQSPHPPIQAAAVAALAEAGDYLSLADDAVPVLRQLLDADDERASVGVRFLAIKALGAIAPALEDRSLLLDFESTGGLQALPMSRVSNVSEALLWAARFAEDPDQLRRLADLLFTCDYDRNIGQALNHMLDRDDALAENVMRRLRQSEDSDQRLLVRSDRFIPEATAREALAEFRALPSVVTPHEVGYRFPPDAAAPIIEQWTPSERKEVIHCSMEYVTALAGRPRSFFQVGLRDYFQVVERIATTAPGQVDDAPLLVDAVIKAGRQFEQSDPSTHAWSTVAALALLDLSETNQLPTPIKGLVYRLLWSTSESVAGPAELVVRTLSRKDVHLVDTEALIEHPSWNLRRLAVDLALSEQQSINQSAIRRLMNDSEMQVRRHVAIHVDYFSRAGYEALAQEVRSHLAVDPSARVRWALNDSLSQCRHEQLH